MLVRREEFSEIICPRCGADFEDLVLFLWGYEKVKLKGVVGEKWFFCRRCECFIKIYFQEASKNYIDIIGLDYDGKPLGEKISETWRKMRKKRVVQSSILQFVDG